MYTIDEIKTAANLYCNSYCYCSCDECCLEDFINFGLSILLDRIKKENE